MTDSSIAVKDFEKKFADKTKNKWADHEKFVAKPGKYTLIEMAGDDEEDFVDAVSDNALIHIESDSSDCIYFTYMLYL